MFSWFGKKEANKLIDGVGSFIDEQQLTKEEQIKFKLHLLEKMEPFKIVQRIIVSIVFGVWAFLIFVYVIGIFVHWLTETPVIVDGIHRLISIEYVWGPTMAASALYLSGGLDFFKRGAKK